MVESLLLWDTLIDRNQDIEAPSHQVEQRSIIEISPTHFGSRSDFMSRQLAPKTPWYAAIEKDTHLSLRSSLLRQRQPCP